MDRDIRNLQEILELEGRADLANLLNRSSSNINQSSTYGSYAFSILSTFEIYSPVKENFSLKKLSTEDRELILNSILLIYPPRPEAPEITGVDFLITNNTNRQAIDQSGLDLEETIENKPNNIRVFVSYSSKERKLAGAFAKFLQELDFEVFLAHNDIEPSTEWQDEILKALKNSDIFIPIVTQNFKTSDWTDQECGIAFVQGLKIIPINAQLNPYGFLGRYQSLSLKKITLDSVQEACEKLVVILRQDPRWVSIMKKNDIKRFVNSINFDDARKNLKKIINIKDLKKEDVYEIVKGAITNNQISGAHSYDQNTGYSIKSIVDRYKKAIDTKLYNKFLRIFNLPN